MTALTALAFARTHWKLFGIMALLLVLAVQTVRLDRRTGQLERAKIANNELRAELKAISDAKNKQAEETKKRIVETEQRIRIAEGIAERIERAPTVPGCKTPPEIMGADL